MTISAAEKRLLLSLEKLGAPSSYPMYQPKGGPIPDLIDLGNAFGPIEDQTSLGSCTAFGATQWYSAWRVKNSQAWVEYSELSQYQQELQDQGTPGKDEGSTVVEAVNVLVNQGVTPEYANPYLTPDFNTPVLNSWIQGSQLPADLVRQIDPNNLLTGIDDALAHGYSVLVGYTTFSGIESPDTAKTGILPMPAAGEQPNGGHCTVIKGRKGTARMYRHRNQWSIYWGQAGEFDMPFDYAAKYISEAYIIEDAGAIPANPIPHDYNLAVWFDKTDYASGDMAHVVIGIFDGLTPINTLYNQPWPGLRFIYPNGQTESGPMPTIDNGTSGVEWSCSAVGEIVAEAKWTAPNGQVLEASAKSMWHAATPPAPVPQKLWHVQVGAFAQEPNAKALLAKLQAAGFTGFIKLE